jgi:acyl-CoA synthetase (NDP forming)
VLSSGLQESLRAALSPEASVHNPIDLIATVDAELYRVCLGNLLSSDEVDAVIAIFVPRESDTMEGVVRAIRETAAAANTSKPILGVFMQTEPLPVAITAPGVPIPSYLFPEAAACALGRAAWYGNWLRTPPGTHPHFPESDTLAARQLVATARERAMSNGGWLDPDTVQRLLISFGLRAPRWVVAHSPDEAIAAAGRWEVPVVVKVIAPSILHKTEADGVQLDLRNEQQIRQAYQRAVEAVDDVHGILVQEYLPEGLEVFIGMNRDPAFGPLMGCGLGGTLVELGGDVAFRLQPLSDRDAAELVESGRLARVLRGYRGRPAGDRAALVEAFLRVSALVDTFPEVAEMDFNPVVVLPSPRGAWVVDARIRVTPAKVTQRCGMGIA